MQVYVEVYYDKRIQGLNIRDKVEREEGVVQNPPANQNPTNEDKKE